MAELGEQTELSIIGGGNMGIDPTLAMAGDRRGVVTTAENLVNEWCVTADPLVQAITYKVLYARGYRIGTIEASIRAAVDEKVR